MVGSAIAKGRIASIDLTKAKAASGVIAIVTAENAGKLGKAKTTPRKLLGGPEIEHYDQAIALMVAETFEQARAAAKLIRVDYVREKGRSISANRSSRPTKGDSGEGSARRRSIASATSRAPSRQRRSRSRAVQHARPEPRDDGAARDHRRVARRCADAVDLHPDDRLDSARYQRHAAAPQGERFYTAIYILLILVGLKLVWQGARGSFER